MKITRLFWLFPLLILTLACLPVHANDDLVLLFSGGGRPLPKASFQYQGEGTPTEQGSPAIQQHALSSRFVVVQHATSTWAVHQRASLFKLEHPLTIPANGLSIPDTMGTVEMGGSYSRRLPGNRLVGVIGSVGSSSDRLFYSRHELSGSITASYRKPHGPRNAWLFFLNYSNTRDFLNNVPLPGVGYYAEAASQKWRAAIGFPFAILMLTPSPSWDARAGLFGPRQMGAEAGRRFGEWRLYTGFEWGSQDWLLADRVNTDNRLFFDRKRASLGVQRPVGKKMELDLSGGREFDRRFFENDDSRHSDVPTLGLHPAWFAVLTISLRV